MGKLDTLFLYHDAVSDYEELEKKVKTTPVRQQYNKLRAFLTEQQNALAKLQKDIAAKEISIAELSQSLSKLEQDYQLELSEFEAMEKDEELTAAELREARQDMEKIIDRLSAQSKELNGALSWLQRTTQEAKNMLSRAAKAKKEYDAVKTQCDEELESFQSAIKEKEEAMKARAKDVPKDLLERYTRIKKNHAMPMAKLVSDQCMGCNMSLPTVVAKRVASDDQIVECENCGRILYL